MKLKVYSIYDKAAKAYNQPFFTQNKALAIRMFSDNVNSQEATTITNHPEHFSIFEIGEYDDATGLITSHVEPKFVSTALELIEETPETDLIKEINSLKQQISTLNLKEV